MGSKDRSTPFLYGGALIDIQRDPEARRGTRVKVRPPYVGRGPIDKTCIQNLQKSTGKMVTLMV